MTGARMRETFLNNARGGNQKETLARTLKRKDSDDSKHHQISHTTLRSGREKNPETISVWNGFACRRISEQFVPVLSPQYKIRKEAELEKRRACI